MNIRTTMAQMEMMTSIKEAILRLIERSERLESVRSEFAYKTYWTDVIRNWDEEKRQIVRSALGVFVEHDEFEENEVIRRYSVPEVGAERHSGVSLRVLLGVLESHK